MKKHLLLILLLSFSNLIFSQKINQRSEIEKIIKGSYSNAFASFKNCDCEVFYIVVDSILNTKEFNDTIDKSYKFIDLKKHIISNSVNGLDYCFDNVKPDKIELKNKIYSELLFILEKGDYDKYLLPVNLYYSIKNKEIDSLLIEKTKKLMFKMHRNDLSQIIHIFGFLRDTTTIPFLKKLKEENKIKNDTDIYCSVITTLIRLGDKEATDFVHTFLKENVDTAKTRKYEKSDMRYYIHDINYMENKKLYDLMFEFLFIDYIYFEVNLSVGGRTYSQIIDDADICIKEGVINNPLKKFNRIYSPYTDKEKKEILNWLKENPDYKIKPYDRN